MRLLLMRHGDAVPSAARDALRALSERGCRQVREAAHRLADEDPPVSRILSSPYIRAIQTAELVRSALNLQVEIIPLNELTPEGHPREAAEALQAAADDCPVLLVVTHQPIISRLIHFLSQVDQPMQTASIAVLDCSLIAQGCGELRCVH